MPHAQRLRQHQEEAGQGWCYPLVQEECSSLDQVESGSVWATCWRNGHQCRPKVKVLLKRGWHCPSVFDSRAWLWQLAKDQACLKERYEVPLWPSVHVSYNARTTEKSWHPREVSWEREHRQKEWQVHSWIPRLRQTTQRWQEKSDGEYWQRWRSRSRG